MSFGWSAGDIAAAITLVYNIVKALDDYDGASDDYREAMAFMRDLSRTLEPLQAFTAWKAYPEYGEQISKQVEYIRDPINKFRDEVLRLEPSLGEKSRKGYHRHVPQKLKWHILKSGKALRLKKQIASHIRVIDTLMQRLTLDVVLAMQQKLPEHICALFNESVRPELVEALREALPATSSTLINSSQQAQDRLESRLLAGIEDIKQHLNNPDLIQRGMKTRLDKYAINNRQHVLTEEGACMAPYRSNDDGLRREASYHDSTKIKESLKEVYYLLFLYLGLFLKGLFIALAQSVQPTQALTTIPLAKYNITFLDAIGRPPRVIHYEYFKSFRMFQAFLREEFINLPGSTWVKHGRFLIMNHKNNRVLDERTWSRLVTPGTTVTMSMVLRKKIQTFAKVDEQKCADTSCSGKWKTPESDSWTTCPLCSKEVFHTFLEPPPDQKRRDSSIEEPSITTKPDQRLQTPTEFLLTDQPLPTSSEKRMKEEFDDDVSAFKRIVQQSWTIDESYETISALIKHNLGLDLPPGMQAEFGRAVVAEKFARKGNLSDTEITHYFEKRYSLCQDPFLQLKDYMIHDNRSEFKKPRGTRCSFEGVISVGGTDYKLVGQGNGPLSSLAKALKSIGLDIKAQDYKEHAIGEGKDIKAVSFLKIRGRSHFGRSAWGVAIHEDVYQSSLVALLSAASNLFGQ
ncbi:hypothetical protein EDB81DRAFT_860734 [Dactylonectria macrodidyma]|uniref:2-isopropylmalate synthase LeuA allosteric (dimerisation) domain-containing protein n=1 Tax=Dactylonectria macrodidyma TaxID=307937 RepID=A0A9P9DVQ2_9HYPO|nr:hypothetical protein EDB81DRAFT_860734 [Dactylonectria macrodidyma]